MGRRRCLRARGMIRLESRVRENRIPWFGERRAETRSSEWRAARRLYEHRSVSVRRSPQQKILPV